MSCTDLGFKSHADQQAYYTDLCPKPYLSVPGNDDSITVATVEPRFNEPLFNEVLDITNDILCPGQSYSKMYGIEPRYNKFFDITNIIQNPKHKIYLVGITNYNVNTRQKINAEQINTLKVSFFCK